MKKKAREEVETVPHIYMDTLNDVVSDTERYTAQPMAGSPTRILIKNTGSSTDTIILIKQTLRIYKLSYLLIS